MRARHHVKQETGERVGPAPSTRSTVRERLESRLEGLGWKVVPGYRLCSAVGYYRIARKYDDTTVCWETWAHRSGDHHPHHLVSYDTMTACARGCEVSQIGDVWWVHATEQTKKST